MKTISFILRFNNDENYIEEVLQSLKKISGSFRSEFIIIDRGSTDGSIDIIKHHSKDLRNVILISDSKKSFRPLDGLSVASGSYISFLNGDSAIVPDGPLHLLEIMQKNSQSLAIGSASKTENSIKPITETLLSHNATEPRVKVIHGMKQFLTTKQLINIDNPAIMMRRDFLSEIYAHNNEYVSEEIHLFVKAATKTHFVKTSKAVYQSLNTKNKTAIYSSDPAAILYALKVLITTDEEFFEKNTNQIYRVIHEILREQSRKMGYKMYYFIKTFFPVKITSKTLVALINDTLEKIL